MMGTYARWMDEWETALANRDTNRVERPFEWGLEWLGLPDGEGSPGRRLAEFVERAVERSGEFFAHATPDRYELEGGTLRFASNLQTAYPENNTVEAEYLPAKNARGRAVLVLPQWNSPPDSHLSLCRLLQRLGISALRMSKAYHHNRKPRETERADYHVSSNLGRTIHATRQSVLDARCSIDWLERRGYRRIGILGTSLGSCVALLAVAHDRRVRTAVFNHVSMNFSDVVWTGMSCRHVRRTLEPHVTQEEMRTYWKVISPSAYLDRLRGRDLHSLLVWGRYDTTFRPEFSREVLRGFQERQLRHRAVCLPCGHYTTGKFPFNWMDAWAMCRFLVREL